MNDDTPAHRLAKITERHRKLLVDATAAYADVHRLSTAGPPYHPDFVTLFEIEDALRAIIETTSPSPFRLADPSQIS